MKITILTPTYNDDKYLPELISSVFSQTYENWQWIIINDGSTDSTDIILSKISDSRVLVLRQENSDQLNAIKSATNYINGDLVTVIHSDDIFSSQHSLSSIVGFFNTCSDIDGVYADLLIINKYGDVDGVVNTFPRSDDYFYICEMILLKNGCNILNDVFCVRRQAYFTYVLDNYINSNKIYFLSYTSHTMMNLMKVSPWYKYRISSENYIRSDVGKFVTLMGQFSTVTSLINHGFHLSLNVFWGYTMFRMLRFLELSLNFINVRYCKFSERYFYFWWKDLSRYDYPRVISEICLSISHSYGVTSHTKCKKISFDSDLPKVYSIRDSRVFYTDYINHQVPECWLSLLSKDFDYISCCGEKELNAIKMMLKFFSLQYEVVIE